MARIREFLGPFILALWGIFSQHAPFYKMRIFSILNICPICARITSVFLTYQVSAKILTFLTFAPFFTFCPICRFCPILWRKCHRFLTFGAFWKILLWNCGIRNTGSCFGMHTGCISWNTKLWGSLLESSVGHLFVDLLILGFGIWFSHSVTFSPHLPHFFQNGASPDSVTVSVTECKNPYTDSCILWHSGRVGILNFCPIFLQFAPFCSPHLH